MLTSVSRSVELRRSWLAQARSHARRQGGRTREHEVIKTPSGLSMPSTSSTSSVSGQITELSMVPPRP
jgi:hypothetical protein